MDGKDEDGISCYSDDDDYGEEGEEDLLDDHAAEIVAKLDPKDRERFQNGEMDEDELQKLGLLDRFDSDLGEEGEFELEDEGADDDSYQDGEKPTKVTKTD